MPLRSRMRCCGEGQGGWASEPLAHHACAAVAPSPPARGPTAGWARAKGVRRSGRWRRRSGGSRRGGAGVARRRWRARRRGRPQRRPGRSAGSRREDRRQRPQRLRKRTSGASALGVVWGAHAPGGWKSAPSCAKADASNSRACACVCSLRPPAARRHQGGSLSKASRARPRTTGPLAHLAAHAADRSATSRRRPAARPQSWPPGCWALRRCRRCIRRRPPGHAARTLLCGLRRVAAKPRE